jgi:hypothetical protein
MIAIMPGCVLRASGANFAVDAFLARSSIVACKIWRSGEPSLVGRQSTTTSGFNAVVSEAADLVTQVSEALAFLREHRGELLRLSAATRTENLHLDFGIPQRNVAAQFERLPSELVRAAGEFRMSIELSLYAVCSEDAPADRSR